jgi:DNA-directed RNA polymerase subunit M/transcription elongation factor TFIIS
MTLEDIEGETKSGESLPTDAEGDAADEAEPLSTAASTAEPTAPLAAASSTGAARVCPHCGAACGGLSLLTSMTRYYLCGRCGARWQVARNSQGVQDTSV